MEPDPKRKVCSAMSMGPKAQTMLTLSKRWGSGATHQDLTLHWSLGITRQSSDIHGSSQRLPLQFAQFSPAFREHMGGSRRDDVTGRRFTSHHLQSFGHR